MSYNLLLHFILFQQVRSCAGRLTRSLGRLPGTFPLSERRRIGVSLLTFKNLCKFGGVQWIADGAIMLSTWPLCSGRAGDLFGRRTILKQVSFTPERGYGGLGVVSATARVPLPHGIGSRQRSGWGLVASITNTRADLGWLATSIALPDQTDYQGYPQFGDGARFSLPIAFWDSHLPDLFLIFKERKNADVSLILWLSSAIDRLSFTSSPDSQPFGWAWLEIIPVASGGGMSASSGEIACASAFTEPSLFSQHCAPKGDPVSGSATWRSTRCYLRPSVLAQRHWDFSTFGGLRHGHPALLYHLDLTPKRPFCGSAKSEVGGHIRVVFYSLGCVLVRSTRRGHHPCLDRFCSLYFRGRHRTLCPRQ
jgi:hypothetical protein